ncbi:unnamed protein product [Darwinula stevensoni]|uniref:Uncharacterized protein n=1 Tax=Darwinula stevensoni TaxID=69355 RepID=A0A7R9AI91_9CRUS|nr:unnamed protein product [Darwinula stevensoni]CAG0905692.1 unnamed protein product [Darwinula stevensoni]
MSLVKRSLVLLCVTLMLASLLVQRTDATRRKPNELFNGSIFGKRSYSDYYLRWNQAACELAADPICQWLRHEEESRT